MNRRGFSQTLFGVFGASLIERTSSGREGDQVSKAGQELSVPLEGWITDVEGIKVGHFTDTRRPTGCTVILCERGGICGVDVRGGWPGTRLTDALDPVKGAGNTIRVDAIVLSGGSNYGLATATGVEHFLREQYLKKNGEDARPRVFAVPAAIIYDIQLGDWRITPTVESGYQACAAAAGGKVAEGNVGVGAGASVGKVFGRRSAMKAGLGTSSIKVGDTGIVVGAIVAVNAIGDVINPKTGKIIAGARGPDGKSLMDQMARIRAGQGIRPSNENTTIAVVATNAVFNKTEMSKIAQMASAALARTINPIFTTGDGDAVFAVSTGTATTRAEHGAIGAIAAEALSEAIVRAVINAPGIPGLPGYRDMK